jgi:hypothetical protein
MAITTDLGGKNYVLGRGRVFFDRFAANAIINATTQGDGERYIGNTPSFSMTSSSEDLDHFDSESGVRTKDASVQLQLDRSGGFECDNIDKENIALYFLGDAATVTQVLTAGIVQVMTVKKGRFYQLGASETLPAGHRMATVTAIGKGAGFATVVTLATNVEFDVDTGRLFILPNAPDIPDNTPIQVTYSIAAVNYERVISKTNAIYGAVRFVSDNPAGVNRDYYLPYVKISPDGDYNMKGDDWQKMGFTMEVLKKATSIEAVYVTTRPTA